MQRETTYLVFFFAMIIYKNYNGTFKVAVTPTKDWATDQSFVFVIQRSEKKSVFFVANLGMSLELDLKMKMTEKDKLGASNKFARL